MDGSIRQSTPKMKAPIVVFGICLLGLIIWFALDIWSQRK